MDQLLPSGAVTFLMSDIEGSTPLWESVPDAMAAAMARHDEIFREVLPEYGGMEPLDQGEGDSVMAVFARASDAVGCALHLQRALCEEPWPEAVKLRVRMAVHTGEALLREGNYLGATLARAARVRALGHGGQVLISGSTEVLARDGLPDGAHLRDLGEHHLKGLSRPERVFQLVHDELPDGFPAIAGVGTTPHNLPLQLTAFFGRAPEMRSIADALAGARLVTLTGPGGVGKSRLAIEAASRMLQQFPDGVWLVPLHALEDPRLVADAVASTLLVRTDGDPLSALIDHLRERRGLVILDTCDHVLDGVVALSGALLRAAAEMRILATSRSPLMAAGEQVLPVEALPVAGQDAPAIALFADRAAHAKAGFLVTDQNVAAVARICERLDGSPLAIELAAARARSFPPERIADLLDDRFRLLTGGARDASPHQRTLRATIDWSYDLLDEKERSVFRRFAVFAGGCTLDAAEAVCGDDPEVFDVVTRLVDRSLVYAGEGDTEGRFLLYETLRAYAADRLKENGEEDAAREAHAAWFSSSATRAAPEIAGPAQMMWLDSLERDHDNFRAALQHLLIDRRDVEGARMAAALAGFWSTRGHLAEASRWLGLAVDVAAEAPAQLRAQLLRASGTVELHRGELAFARTRYEAALPLVRMLNDRHATARVLNELGAIAYREGDDERARTSIGESLDLARELGDRQAELDALNNLAALSLRAGDAGEATEAFTRCLSIARELGNDAHIASLLSNLGYVAQISGRGDQARAQHEEALAIRRALHHVSGVISSLSNLAELERTQGAHDHARAYAVEALALAIEIGDRHAEADLNELIGSLAEAAGDDAAAREHFDRSAEIARLIGAKPLL
ncbi:MAG TPA: tetratricopeptide repeat protein, partial [Actinomycetota bacterium]|nr:tetratricopeptide repeat protein [Actinomycetota bacterium]